MAASGESLKSRLIALLKSLRDGCKPAVDSSVAVVIEGLRAVASSGDFSMAAVAFDVLHRCSQEPAFRASLTGEGRADTIVSALHAAANASDAAAQAGMMAVCALAAHADWRAALAAASVGGCIVELLRRERTTAQSLQAACDALQEFSGDESDECSFHPAMIDAGAPAALTAVLVERRTEPSVVTMASMAACALARHEDGRVALGRAGAIPALIGALHTHVRHPGVVALTCAPLGELILNVANRAEMHARDEAGVAAVIDGLRHNEGSADAVAAACVVLTRVAIDTEAAPHLVRDAVPLIIAAMRRHQDNAKVNFDALGTLNNCILDRAHVPAVFRAGALTVTLEALRRHPSNVDVCDFACSVLARLLDREYHKGHADTSRALKAESMSAGKELIKALLAHARHPMVALQGSTALARVLVQATSAQQAELVHEGAAQALVAALKQYPRNPFLVRAACIGLSELAGDGNAPAIVAELSKAKMPAAVAVALRENLALSGPDDAPQQATGVACIALAKIVHLQPEASVMARLGSAEHVTAALVSLKDDVAFAAACCFVLKYLAFFPDAQPARLWGATLDALADAIRLHESSNSVVVEAAGALTQPPFRSFSLSRDVAQTLVRAVTRRKGDAKGCWIVPMAMQNFAMGNEANKQLLLREVCCRCCSEVEMR